MGSSVSVRPVGEPRSSRSPNGHDASGELLRYVIADDVRDRIISGTIKPGRCVREDEVAADHGVPRVPVREALQKLEAEDCLTLVPYRGAVVATPSPQNELVAEAAGNQDLTDLLALYRGKVE
jgi:DNA-binding GntR family transcriptional regulator